MKNASLVKCFASNIVIRPGDRCFVLPVIQNHSERSLYVTARFSNAESLHSATDDNREVAAYWKPLGDFLEGTHEGNGRVRLGRSEANVRSLVGFVKRVYEDVPDVESSEPHYGWKDYFDDFAEKARDLLEAKAPVEDFLNDEDVLVELIEIFEEVQNLALKNRWLMSSRTGPVVPALFAYMSKPSHDELVSMVVQKASLTVKSRNKTTPAEPVEPEWKPSSGISREDAEHRRFLASVLNDIAARDNAPSPLEEKLQNYGKANRSVKEVLAQPSLATAYVVTGLTYLGVGIFPVITTDVDSAADYAKFFAAVQKNFAKK